MSAPARLETWSSAKIQKFGYSELPDPDNKQGHLQAIAGPSIAAAREAEAETQGGWRQFWGRNFLLLLCSRFNLAHTVTPKLNHAFFSPPPLTVCFIRTRCLHFHDIHIVWTLNMRFMHVFVIITPNLSACISYFLLDLIVSYLLKNDTMNTVGFSRI